MFVFLSRTGRLLVASIIVAALTTVVGASTIASLPVASKHNDPGSCTVALGSVINGQQRLLITAVGLPAGTSFLEAQTGVQSVWITTDASGDSTDQSLYYHGAGTYSIAFDYYYWSNNKLVQATATGCSARL